MLKQHKSLASPAAFQISRKKSRATTFRIWTSLLVWKLPSVYYMFGQLRTPLTEQVVSSAKQLLRVSRVQPEPWQWPIWKWTDTAWKITRTFVFSGQSKNTFCSRSASQAPSHIVTQNVINSGLQVRIYARCSWPYFRKITHLVLCQWILRETLSLCQQSREVLRYFIRAANLIFVLQGFIITPQEICEDVGG